MIEDLTKEKLELYGFSESQIERLFTWEDYTCAVINGRGYLWASNKEKKIYSGIEGKEKHFSKSIFPQHHKEPKEKFETFTELYRYAVLAGSIERPKNLLIGESQHNFTFNTWLQNYRGLEYGNEAAYKELLTRENWVGYLEHCEAEKEEVIRNAELLKAKWKPTKNVSETFPTLNNERQMKYFNEFIAEVQTIEIRIKEYYVQDGEILDWTPDEVPGYDKLKGVKRQEFLDLSHYDQHKTNYDNEIKKLQQLAINDLLQMGSEQINLQLKRIEQIIKRFEKFYPHYFKLCKDLTYKQLFDNEMNNLFILSIPSHKNIGEAFNIQYSNLHDWHDAIMFKETYLKGFETQIKKVLDLNDTEHDKRAFTKKDKTQKKAESKDYSHRQIAIAYCIMGKLITSENAATILGKHSQWKSTDKLLAKRINNPSSLTKLAENKTTDSKTRKDLQAAKRLISGMKNKKAETDIDRIITAFETAYQNKY